MFRFDTTEGRAGACEDGGSLLYFFKASLTTPRWVLALRGREGCDSLVKLDEKVNDDVVGKANRKGISRETTELRIRIDDCLFYLMLNEACIRLVDVVPLPMRYDHM